MPIGGFSYDPSSQPMQQSGGSPRTLSPQEAVRILSLRLPKNPQNSPVPQALLQSAGGGATSNLTALLQALMQASRPEGGGQGSREMVSDAFVPPVDNGFQGARQMPQPRVTIGEGGDRGVVDEPPTPVQGGSQEFPLFDQGIPPIRNMPRKSFMDMAQPLF